MKSFILAIIINELMSANVGTVMSPATNFDSWIELYNPTEQVIDLKGYYLSNDENDLTRWQMPADIGTIPAHGYLVVWMGSDDIKSNQAPFHLDCDGGTIFLTNPQGELVTSVAYPQAMSRTAWARKGDGSDEWGWTSMPTPGATNATSVFASERLDPPVVDMGSRLFQDPFSFQVTIPEGTTLLYTTDGSMPTSTEGLSDEESTYSWTDWIMNGDCEGEYNECFVSKDGDGTGTVWRIVDGAGVNGSRGIEVHAVENPEYEWDTQFFVYTPKHIWQAGEPYRFSMMVRADKPVYVSAQAHRAPGDYIHWNMVGGGFNVTTEWKEFSYEGTITEEQAGDGMMQTIAFNLNNEKLENNFYFDNISWEAYGDPNATNGMTARISKDGQFSVSKTTNYVFRLFKDGYLPSVPVTRSFLKTNNTYTIPVVSIVGDERYFTDAMWGIDVKGQNGITGNGSDDPVNWNQPWDRPVNFSFISPTDGMLFNQDVNISVSGGWTRSASPRSMKLKSNKVFDGQNHLDYSFFPQKPYIRSKTLLIRNGGNDVWNNNARFMDPALTTIIQRSGIDLDVQSFVQVVEYLNGKFKGVLNMREPNNDKFVYANWGYDDDVIDMFENLDFRNGTDAAFKQLCELAKQVNNEGVYEQIRSLLDVDEFINYMAAEIYLGNDDWPNNNVKAYRDQDDGRFRYVCFDLDYTFNPWDHNTFTQVLDNYKSIPTVTLFINLLKHDGFRRQFIDAYCIMAGSVFEQERATAIVDELAEAMRPMSEYDGLLPDKAANKIKNELNGRLTKMMARLKQYSPMKLSNVTAQNVVLTSDIEDATLLVNGLRVPYSYFNGQLFPPVSLEAVAPAGYVFTGWVESSSSTVKLFSMNSSWKYYDQGEVTNNSWKENGFDDSSWSRGTAPLGYNMTGVTTTIGYGSDDQRKNPTTYFRKTLTLNETPAANDFFQLSYQLDDGCVIWVNGKEAGRVNMTSGTVRYTTFSSTYAGSEPTTGTLNLSPTLFKKGTNVIAVEVHNTSYTSSDLFWACELFTSVGGRANSKLYSEPVIDLPEGATLELRACFEALSNEERTQEGLTPVCINEVSAANDIYVNEFFKHNDWVELYNTTGEPIDVAGMYLTDNLNKPKKYQIAGGEGISTIIPAHGYLVIWCDKLEAESQLHASFKLDADGGDVQIMAEDESWSNRLAYPLMRADETVGRYPDGATDVFVMNVPTIAKTNIMSSYVINVEQPEQTAIGDVIVKKETEGSGQVYNLAGQAVQGTLAPGIYIRNGRKFIVR